MNPRDLDAARIDELRRQTGAEHVELFVKRGRSRRLVLQRQRELAAEADEQGWAVRVSRPRGSFFAAGTGEPVMPGGWPEADGYPLELPPPGDLGDWTPARRSESPLASESEVRMLARKVAEELARALPESRIDALTLEDGQSESAVGSSEGVLAGWRTRLCSLAVEASLGGERPVSVRSEWVRREPGELSPSRLASRVADQLVVAREGRRIARDRCEMVVAPEVATHLLAALEPLWRPETSQEAVARLGGEALAAGSVTLIDDGRLAGGLLASPVDGEGTPTREIVLIEEGRFKQPLLPWNRSMPGCRSGGCSRRESWRDEPRLGISHLYLRPDAALRAAELVAGLSRGYYLLDVGAAGRFDVAADRFELPVRGFEILGGRARMPVAGVRLVGRISAWLEGVRSVARDLTFVRHPVGLIGSPTLRLGGLELRD